MLNKNILIEKRVNISYLLAFLDILPVYLPSCCQVKYKYTLYPTFSLMLTGTPYKRPSLLEVTVFS